MFQKLLSKDRVEVVLPHEVEDQRLTRYSPEDARPQGSAHLTRFSRRHIREGAAHRVREEPFATPAELRTAPTEPQSAPQQGPDLDLYSDEPISINVLKRALPERFAVVRSDISDAFEQENTLRKQA